MTTETVAAKDLQVGDYIYNSLATQEAFRWVRINHLKERLGPVTLEFSGVQQLPVIDIHTSGWMTTKSPDEAVTRRKRVEGKELSL